MDEIPNTDGATKPWLFNAILSSYVKQLGHADPASSVLAALNEFRRQRSLPPLPAESATTLLRSALCHVEVESIGRGSPSDMAMLYDLTVEERKEWLQALASDSRGGDNFDPLSSSQSAMLQVGRLLATPCRGLFANAQLGQNQRPNQTIVGFVSTGNISLTRGNGHGLATIKLDAYLKLLQVATASGEPNRVICKVKNRDGLVTRLVSLVLVQ